MFPRNLLAISATILLCACGGHHMADEMMSPAEFGAAPLLTQKCQSGSLTLELRTAPQPATRGNNLARIRVTDANGAIVSGLHVTAEPWMPAMGHGVATKPVTTEPEPGVYELNPVYLPMAGTWQLRVDLSGAVTDHADLEVTVP